MCKANESSDAQGSERSQRGGSTPSSEEADCRSKSFELDIDEKTQQTEVIAHDKASGVVVFGAFVAGALVGIIICAPAFIVLVFGAGAAAISGSDTKAGKFFRKVGKVASDFIFAVFRKGREVNAKYRLTDKAKDAAQQASARARAEIQKSGLGEKIKTKARAVWAHVDERTAPRQAREEGEQLVEAAPVTDGTQLPFDGSSDVYYSADGKSVPKSFDA